MKLKFKQQDFQTEAVNAVADLFCGQERRQSTFGAFASSPQKRFTETDFGVGNLLLLDDDALLANMQRVQSRNRLPQTDDPGRQFCIEMETGTGKTYVYTKTILELNRRYGFKKFIVVVPSVAIREGVYQSLCSTKEHFSALYEGIPYRYFIYQSAHLSDIRQFITSNNIEIMIINIDAFRKVETVIRQPHEKLGDKAAIGYIQKTRPIVIIDEPQSVDTTPKAKEAIAALCPLCVLRYSATHRDKVNLLYRLTPVDAYQMGLVKQICVSSNTVADGHNKPYIKLLSVSHTGGFSARISLDIQDRTGTVGRKTRTVRTGDDLYVLSGKRDLYQGYIVTGINCTPGFESIEFANTEYLERGKSIGDVDEMVLKRAQIYRTIEKHLEKERLYYQKGIKVLSLFFIDEVQKYRKPDGSAGIYAQIFEECYAELMALPKFACLRDHFPTEARGIHNGYFSQDRTGAYKNTRGNTIEDTDTYNAIMRDKEWLLRFDCPLRFLFSHSALKEGWDNPNVFQVCVLLDQKSTFTCRQKVGRGLRLCVNQTGERVEDPTINTLHVICNETFAQFTSTLQNEIEEETGVRFFTLEPGMFLGITYTAATTVQRPVTQEQAALVLSALRAEGHLPQEGPAPHTALPEVLLPIKRHALALLAQQSTLCAEDLAGLTYPVVTEEARTIGDEDVKALFSHFYDMHYLSPQGQIQKELRAALASGALCLPQSLEGAREQLESVLRKVSRPLPVSDDKHSVTVRLREELLTSALFLECWNRLRQKTFYRVQYDDRDLLRRCVDAIRDMPAIPRARVISQTADIHIEQSGITHTERELRTLDIVETYALPDILSLLQEECQIPRTLCRDILLQSDRLDDFVKNPQLFLQMTSQCIKQVLLTMETEAIHYEKKPGCCYSPTEIFSDAEIAANLDKNAVPVKNSVYDHVIYDSAVERAFALALSEDPDVKLFFKLPQKWKIDTPVGSYTPDWVVLAELNGKERLLVLETKGNLNLLDQRTREQCKIHCGIQHFSALNSGVHFAVVTDWRAWKKTFVPAGTA